jgi:hypothetical protein
VRSSRGQLAGAVAQAISHTTSAPSATCPREAQSGIGENFTSLPQPRRAQSRGRRISSPA